MSTRIPEGLRQVLAEEYQDEALRRVLAAAFNYGAAVAFHPNGSRHIYPGAVLEIGVGDAADDNFTAVETPTEDWSRLLCRPPKQTEIAVFPGNMNRGAQGKHDQNTWEKDDLNTDNAPFRRGYPVTGGHRGGMRQANNPAALKALFRRSSPRKYR